MLYRSHLLWSRLAAGVQALGPASWDWQERAHKLVWKFKRVQGGTDLTLKVEPSMIYLHAYWWMRLPAI